MNTGSVTVQEAIARGLKIVERPAKIILISATALCILLMVLDFSWADLLLLPLGLVLSYLYTMYGTPKWRIWAYGQVNDIWQFQRAAELAGLLMRQSAQKMVGFMSERQRELLQQLQIEFEQEPVFVDDLSIPVETPVYARSFFGTSTLPAMIISEAGIQLVQGAYYHWDKITDEHVALVSFSRTDPNFGGEMSAGSKRFFRFTGAGQRFEMPLSSLKIDDWKLDLLLYIYRGRFELKRTHTA